MVVFRQDLPHAGSGYELVMILTQTLKSNYHFDKLIKEIKTVSDVVYSVDSL